MNLKNAASLFLISCEASCTPVTVSGYRLSLDMFFKWLEDSCGLQTDRCRIEDVTRDLIAEYMIYLRGRGIKNTSVASYLRSIRTFFNWCFKEEYTDRQIFYKIRMPKNDKEAVIPLYAHEVEVIDKCFDKKTVYGLRNLLIVHLMLDAGLRSLEVTRLRCSDILLKKNLLHVYGKGSKYRIVFLCPKLKELACLYMVLAHGIDISKELPDEPLLFKKDSREGITGKTVTQIFARLKKQSGIGRVHAHLCRHTFATSYIMGGGNMELLRMFLGHSDYSITKEYMHIANQFLMMDADIYRLDAVFFKTLYRES